MADGEHKADVAKCKAIRIQTGVLKRTAKEKMSYVKQAEEETKIVEKMEAEGRDSHDIKLRRNCRDESSNMVKVVGRNLTAAHEKLTGLMREVEDDAPTKRSDEYKKMLEAFEEVKPALAYDSY